MRTGNSPSLLGCISKQPNSYYYKYIGYLLDILKHKEMEIKMNYLAIYYALINNAKKRSIEIEKYVIDNKIHYRSINFQKRYISQYLSKKYNIPLFEAHHINPQSDGGENILTNLVWFTPKEHVIAHHLLYKAQPTKNHFLAWHYLTFTDKNKSNMKHRLTSTEREELANKNAEYARNKIVTEDTRKLLSIRSTGKSNGMYGRHWYTNGIVNITCKDGEEPDGFYKGRLDVVPKNKKYSTAGYHYYNNGIVNQLFKSEQDIPDGFVPGMIRTNKKCYNNGIKNIYLSDTDDIPDGYHLGMIKSVNCKTTKSYIAYTNGEKTIYLPKDKLPPEGFKPGSYIKPNLNYKWYNNGIITKRFKNDDIIPEGFIKGRLKREKKNEN